MVAEETHEPDLHQVVAELTRPHTHREPFDYQDANDTKWPRHHESQVPSLIHQLLYASPSRGSETGSGFTSRPTAHVEAIDALMAIDDEASKWVKRLGHDDPGDTFLTVHRYRFHGPTCLACRHQSCRLICRGERVQQERVHGSGTIACINLLHGLQASARRCSGDKPKRDKKAVILAYCCTAHHIEADIRRWRFQARIVSGWDKAPFRPNQNTCPICEVRGGLRVRVLDRTAMCIECHETWDEATIGILGEHIRAENGEALTEPAPTHTTETDTRHAG